MDLWYVISWIHLRNMDGSWIHHTPTCTPRDVPYTYSVGDTQSSVLPLTVYTEVPCIGLCCLAPCTTGSPHTLCVWMVGLSGSSVCYPCITYGCMHTHTAPTAMLRAHRMYTTVVLLAYTSSAVRCILPASCLVVCTRGVGLYLIISCMTSLDDIMGM